MILLIQPFTISPETTVGFSWIFQENVLFCTPQRILNMAGPIFRGLILHISPTSSLSIPNAQLSPLFGGPCVLALNSTPAFHMPSSLFSTLRPAHPPFNPKIKAQVWSVGSLRDTSGEPLSLALLMLPHSCPEVVPRLRSPWGQKINYKFYLNLSINYQLSQIINFTWISIT